MPRVFILEGEKVPDDPEYRLFCKGPRNLLDEFKSKCNESTKSEFYNLISRMYAAVTDPDSLDEERAKNFQGGEWESKSSKHRMYFYVCRERKVIVIDSIRKKPKKKEQDEHINSARIAYPELLAKIDNHEYLGRSSNK